MRNILPLFFLVPVVSFATGGSMTGSGTAADPWQVADYEDLKKVGESPYTLNGHYRLVADIDASASKAETFPDKEPSSLSGFKPIGQVVHATADSLNPQDGKNSAAFSGTFNGAGHVISNLNIVNFLTPSTGFFFELDSSARLDSLTLKNYYIKSIYSGGIAGVNRGTISNVHVESDSLDFVTSAGGFVSENYGTISNSSFSGTMYGAYVAGIAYDNYGTITKCEVVLKNGNIPRKATMFGGIANNNRGVVSDCKASGEIYATVNIGGIAAVNYGIVERCSSSVDINGTGGTDNLGTIVKNVAAIGGLVAVDSGKIYNSHASGNVTALASNIGGLVGITFGEIDSCTASGTVKALAFSGAFVGTNRGKINNSSATGKVVGSSYLGGFVGNNFGKIENSYAEGNVEFTGASGGGFVARNETDGNINYCYATGNVNGYNYAGGFAGENNGNIKGSHANGHVKGSTSVGGFVGKQEGGSVESSYSTGVVYGEIYVAGFAGGIWKNASVSDCYSTGDIIEGEILVAGFASTLSGSTVSNSFSLGNIYSTSDNFHEAGSFVGVADSASAVKNSYSMGGITNKVSNIEKLCAMENVKGVEGYYWNSDNCTPADTANYGIQLTSEQMKSKESFVGFDFGKQWEYLDGISFPTLVSVPFDTTFKDSTGFFGRGPERYVPGSDDPPVIVKPNPVTVARLTVPFTCRYTQGDLQISFSLPRSGMADIRILDLQGREVGKVPANRYASGSREVRWDASGLKRGRYLTVLRLDGKVVAKSGFAKR